MSDWKDCFRSTNIQMKNSCCDITFLCSSGPSLDVWELHPFLWHFSLILWWHKMFWGEFSIPFLHNKTGKTVRSFQYQFFLLNKVVCPRVELYNNWHLLIMSQVVFCFFVCISVINQFIFLLFSSKLNCILLDVNCEKMKYPNVLIHQQHKKTLQKHWNCL